MADTRGVRYGSRHALSHAQPTPPPLRYRAPFAIRPPLFSCRPAGETSAQVPAGRCLAKLTRAARPRTWHQHYYPRLGWSLLWTAIPCRPFSYGIAWCIFSFSSFAPTTRLAPILPRPVSTRPYATCRTSGRLAPRPAQRRPSRWSQSLRAHPTRVFRRRFCCSWSRWRRLRRSSFCRLTRGAHTASLWKTNQEAPVPRRFTSLRHGSGVLFADRLRRFTPILRENHARAPGWSLPLSVLVLPRGRWRAAIPSVHSC